MSQQVFVGIDVSKKFLDIHVLPSGQGLRFPNTRAGIARLSKRLLKYNPYRVAVEATGGYEQPVLAALFVSGLAACLINPLRIRQHAKSIGKLAKTDSIDASVIAGYISANHEHVRLFVLRQEQALKALVARRRQLVGMRTSEKNRLDRTRDSLIRADINTVIAALDRRVRRMDRQIAETIRSKAQWQTNNAIMRSVPSVGPVTASTLIAEMPEMGEANRKEVSALAGVAPFNDDSGEREGDKAISGGRREVRSVIYMATLSAIHHNPVIKQFYQRLKAKGKPTKVAMTACARKLLTILNAMLHKGEMWKPKIA